MRKKIQAFVFLLVSPAAFVMAQDDLLKELEQTTPKTTEYAFQTFKGTRLVNGHSVETKSKGTLEFIFAHRFDAINSPSYDLYGFDNAYVRLGLEYGVTDRLGIGIGRSSKDKIINAYTRYKIFKQQKGATNFPLTVTFVGDISYKTPQDGKHSIDWMAYVGELLIARKFSPRFSMQLMPTIVHRNTVEKLSDRNDIFSLGFGSRMKVSKSIALTTEYYYRLNPKKYPSSFDPSNPPPSKYYNAVGLGIDFETGGHVFQLVVTNTTGTTDRTVITQTDGKISRRDIHFGFNVTRTFQLKRK